MTDGAEVFFLNLRHILGEFDNLFACAQLAPATALNSFSCGNSTFSWGSVLWGEKAVTISLSSAIVNLCSENRIMTDGAQVFFFHLRRFLTLTTDEFDDLFAFVQQLQDSCEKWLRAISGCCPRRLVELLVIDQFVRRLPAETALMVLFQQPGTPNQAIQLAVNHLYSPYSP